MRRDVSGTELYSLPLTPPLTRHGLGLHLGFEPHLIVCPPLLILFPQPGKLTEAFKYFLQGMGYSEYGGQRLS